jgi:hypothetical protein
MISDPNSREFKEALDRHITREPDYEEEEEMEQPEWMLTENESDGLDQLATMLAQARKLVMEIEKHFAPTSEAAYFYLIDKVYFKQLRQQVGLSSEGEER